MPDPNDPRHTSSQDNAAWRLAQQWQERARQSRPGGNVGGLKLLLTWLLFGLMMIIGTIIGLIFLLIGWAMLPFLRHRMKKRMDKMRADQAQDIGGTSNRREEAPGDRPHDARTLEGDYVARDDDRP